MNKQREALEMALKALEDYQTNGAPFFKCDSVVAAIREALAEQELEPKPYAWHWTSPRTNGSFEDHIIYAKHYFTSPGDRPYVLSCATGVKELYTAPPIRKPLTEEQINDLELPPSGCNFRDIVRAIERAHGIGGE